MIAISYQSQSNTTMKPATRFAAIADPTVMNLLKLTEQPKMISFAGGTPSFFAADLIDEAVRKTKLNLQYSPTPGTSDMRQAAAAHLSQRWKTAISPEEILITSGSQQTLDIIARTYINPADTILVENPTYFVALYAFNAYQPQYTIFSPDQPLPTPPKASKFLYIVSNFQNPTGNTLNTHQRQKIMDYAQAHDMLIVEDDPYSQLYFNQPPPPSMYVSSQDSVIYTTTLSKIISPALRLGITVAKPEIIAQLSRVKQGMDLCTSALTQSIASYVLAHPKLDTHLSAMRAYYKKRAEFMDTQLNTHLKKVASWKKPSGGLFIWLTFSNNLDTKHLYSQAIKKNVAFIPGYVFDPHTKPSPHARITFASASPADTITGIKRLQQAVKEL